MVWVCALLAAPAAAQRDLLFPSLAGEPAQPEAAETAPPPAASAFPSLGGFPRAAANSVVRAPASYYSEYRVAAQDLLDIAIWEAPEFTRSVRVAPDGTIRLPLAKSPIEVAGLSVLETERRVAQAMVDEGLLVDPIVAVTVLEFHGNPVQISGAVRSPAVVQAIGPTTLLSAITQAGGIDPSRAGPEIIIEKPGAETVRFPTREFAEGVNGVQDYRLSGGERIRVEPAGSVTVFGAVNKTGEFPVPDREGMEFLELLSRAGGTRREAAGKAIILRPVPGGGGRERIEVNLGKVLKYEVGDLRVHPDDIVYVPDSRLKQFALRLGEAAAFQWMLRMVFF